MGSTEIQEFEAVFSLIGSFEPHSMPSNNGETDSPISLLKDSATTTDYIQNQTSSADAVEIDANIPWSDKEIALQSVRMNWMDRLLIVGLLRPESVDYTYKTFPHSLKLR
ncbi:unnamed protein product [Protopolystoma xenopodis]|uniref:Uncharacterized protein n=1 Tax=Protopolystoma xenopodis TaxID=117903 RepID=A0A3S5CH88_9PLAT|nr:unnamed protein product [Protopolystoma xenopodis]